MADARFGAPGCRLVLGAVDMSWIPEDRNRDMVTALEGDPAWILNLNED